jgi:CubicO group peptidase (beta-lactamase class C family)
MHQRLERSAGLLVGALLLLGAACSAPEAPREPETGTADVGPAINRFIEQVVAAHDVPGVTASVVRDGAVLHTVAMGTTGLDDGADLSPEHLFHFASVSKPFVATAVMQLVERGEIDLDAPVTTYLPYFRLAEGPYAEINVRQMLDHTSGMPDVEDYEWDRPQVDEGAAERYVRSLEGESMIGLPGEQWRYSNMAFDTLGDVIAKVSGLSFEDYVEQRILDPLGMVESTFLYPATREALRTRGHVWNLGPTVSEHYPYNRRHAPSSTLNSSVAEMTRWALANLNRGELDGSRILDETSYDLLWTPSAEVRDGMAVGLSWFVWERSGVRAISHGGGDTGFSSYIVLMPEENTGFVLASNYDRTPMGILRDGLFDILTGREPERPLRPIGYDFAAVYLERGIEAGAAFYRRAATERADDYAFSPDQLNTLGYFLLRDGDVDRAIEVFAFNVQVFPEVANGYDSLGEAWLAKGDEQQARINYAKALELDPGNAHARQVLAELGPSP